jgi:hypothetical protein
VEVRLVLGHNGNRRTAAVVSDGGSGQVAFTVPDWAPDGAATVEATCLEPDLSNAGDGAEVPRFDYEPVALRIAGPGKVRKPPVLDVVTPIVDGRLDAHGRGCFESVKVAVAQGTDRVASADRYHYGTYLTTPDAQGRWSIDEPIRYAVSTFSDPVAPGPMVVFAFCGERAYEPVRVKVQPRSPSPAVHVLDFAPGGLYLSQCLAGKTLTITSTATTAGGTTTTVTTVPGPGYGEQVTFVDLPAGVQRVTHEATCTGPSGPAFTYVPATWTAT